MIGKDFVKEIQKGLLTQQDYDPASRASPNVTVWQTEAHKDWDTLVAWMEGKVAEINNGLPEPLLLYSIASKPASPIVRFTAGLVNSG